MKLLLDKSEVHFLSDMVWGLRENSVLSRYMEMNDEGATIHGFMVEEVRRNFIRHPEVYAIWSKTGFKVRNPTRKP
jgi:hypothetical protein